MILGVFVDLFGDFRMDTRIVNMETGEILKAQTVRSSRSNICGLVRELTEEITTDADLPPLDPGEDAAGEAHLHLRSAASEQEEIPLGQLRAHPLHPTFRHPVHPGAVSAPQVPDVPVPIQLQEVGVEGGNPGVPLGIEAQRQSRLSSDPNRAARELEPPSARARERTRSRRLMEDPAEGAAG